MVNVHMLAEISEQLLKENILKSFFYLIFSSFFFVNKKAKFLKITVKFLSQSVGIDKPEETV